jgi:Holliday junction resolvase RusA-like endonuclease
MKLTINGSTPALKNAKQIFINRRTGKPFITSSNLSKEWQSSAKQQLREQFEGYKITDYPISIAMEFYFKTKRAKDLDNAATSVLDAMVAAGVIEDDNINYVDSISISFSGYDKENPRCIIFLDD